MTGPVASPAADPGWRFDNSYARLPADLFTPSAPVAVRAPRLAWLNRPLAESLGLDPDRLAAGAPEWLSGNVPPPGAEPIAQAYAGHQYGHFTNLGDGRAILLGEQLAPSGTRHDVQLKGAGRTRYSRSGDGRAALGPMLREAIVGEAMHALGIPTTRGLSVVATGEAVYRERPLPGAILTRVAASHLRVGTFQYAAALGRRDLLEALLAHTIARHDPDLAGADDAAARFLKRVIDRQAALVARWMAVGFVHGVMNTDNVAVSGETIDYGPCAFVDAWDPDAVFSSIDEQGRYRLSRQPSITLWNLARLAEALLPLLSADEAAAIDAANSLLATFEGRYEQARLALFRAKLGLADAEEGDAALVARLLDAMAAPGADFTATFRALGSLAGGDAAAPPVAGDAFAAWLVDWRARIARQPGGADAARALALRSNPAVIPRNHRVEEVLAAACVGDMTPFDRLLAAITRPFAPLPEDEPLLHGPPPGSGCYRTFCGT